MIAAPFTPVKTKSKWRIPIVFQFPTSIVFVSYTNAEGSSSFFLDILNVQLFAHVTYRLSPYSVHNGMWTI